MLTCDDLIAGWRALGVGGDAPLLVHASLSSLGEVYGGAPTVVHSLLSVAPTLVVPAFRNAPMGAVSAYVESMPSALLSTHPVVPSRPRLVGSASCRLVPMRPFRSFAVRRLTELLGSDGE